MKQTDPQGVWVAPHASWIQTSTGSYIDGNLLMELIKKGTNNSLQVTTKLYSAPSFYNDTDLEALGRIDFKTYAFRKDILFTAIAYPDNRSNRLDPTPIVITTRDMNNYVLGYLSLIDLQDLMAYTTSVSSYNAARILFSFVFGIPNTEFKDYWYSNILERLPSKEAKALREEDEKFVQIPQEDLSLEARNW